MRILVVTAYQQLRPEAVSGFVMRQRLFIDALTRIGAELHVLYFMHHDPLFGGGPDTLNGLEKLVRESWGGQVSVTLCRRANANQPNRARGKGFSVRQFFKLPGYASLAHDVQRDAFEDALMWNPDFVFVHRLVAMPPVLQSRRPLPPIAFDLDDIESVALRRRLFSAPFNWQHWPEWLHLPAIVAGEKLAFSLADLTFVCSPDDVAALSKRGISGEVISVPNAVPVPTIWRRSQLPNLLMLGSYGHWPNRSGIEYFVSKIWPVIHAAVPDANLRVAGPGGDQLSFATAPPPGVTVCGYVDDLAKLYADSAIVICPIYSGSGTRVKLIEAAGYGIPAVSTKIGAEGLDFIDGIEISIAHNAAEFAAKCVELLLDSVKADAMAEAVRTAAETRYDREVVVMQLADCFREFASSSQTKARGNESFYSFENVK